MNYALQLKWGVIDSSLIDKGSVSAADVLENEMTASSIYDTMPTGNSIIIDLNVISLIATNRRYRLMNDEVLPCVQATADKQYRRVQG
jgi:hypothetical protein